MANYGIHFSLLCVDLFGHFNCYCWPVCEVVICGDLQPMRFQHFDSDLWESFIFLKCPGIIKQDIVISMLLSNTAYGQICSGRHISLIVYHKLQADEKPSSKDWMQGLERSCHLSFYKIRTANLVKLIYSLILTDGKCAPVFYSEVPPHPHLNVTHNSKQVSLNLSSWCRWPCSAWLPSLLHFALKGTSYICALAS